MNNKTLMSSRASRMLRTTTSTLPAVALLFAGTAVTSVSADTPKPSVTMMKAEVGAKVAPQYLNAGPIHLKFADGELRYLYVGDREIVRRIYFAVRNGRWDTATPVFSKIAVHSHNDTFVIDLEATCKTEGVDYKWTGYITGAADGTITYHATGTSGAAFQSNRIGICVLYGTPAVTGTKYETTVEPADGSPIVQGVFPEYVSPQLVAGKFSTLRHDTPDGTTVVTTVTGTKFDMEDQRTYGDSSFKAYAPLAYSYPEIPANSAKEETVTVSLPKAPKGDSVSHPSTVIVRVGKIIEGARIPKISVDATPAQNGDFGSVNGQQEKLAGKKALVWSYTSSTHLLDNDVLMENVQVLRDQVRSVHVFAPDAKITLNPIVLNVHYKGAGNDPRGADAFGAAWTTMAVKQMAIAGVDQAIFATGPGLGASRQKEFAALAGRHIYDVLVNDRPGLPRIDGFLIENNGKPGSGYLINRSSEIVRVRFQDWPGLASSKGEIEIPPYSGVSL